MTVFAYMRDLVITTLALMLLTMLLGMASGAPLRVVIDGTAHTIVWGRE